LIAIVYVTDNELSEKIINRLCRLYCSTPGPVLLLTAIHHASTYQQLINRAPWLCSSSRPSSLAHLSRVPPRGLARHSCCFPARAASATLHGALPPACSGPATSLSMHAQECLTTSRDSRRKTKRAAVGPPHHPCVNTAP
jgi:hypothetical protein